MAKKYVATIMNRLYLGDNNFIYYLSHTAVGDYDEKNHIFKDRNGIEYLPITDPNLLISEITTGFANLEEMNKLPRMVGQPNMKDAISDYNYYCGRFIYYVSKTDDNKTFCVPIDYYQVKENLNLVNEKIMEHGGI